MNHRLPLYSAARDSPGDLCVKDSLIEACLDHSDALDRLAELDPLDPTYPYHYSAVRRFEKRADDRIRELWKRLGRTT